MAESYRSVELGAEESGLVTKLAGFGISLGTRSGFELTLIGMVDCEQED